MTQEENVGNKLSTPVIKQNVANSEIENKNGIVVSGTSTDSIPGFSFLHEKTYSCGGQTHTVKEYHHDKTGMEFAKIPGKSFMMGGNDYAEKPEHRVTLSSFLISKTEVTQGVWQKVMATTPWKGKESVKEGNNYTATYISWNDAKKFCDCVGLELPTEAQWEYACCSGNSDKYYWGNDMDSDYAWYRDNTFDVGNKHAHQVAQKKPNAFGLYDMSGNVWEWCHDYFDYNSTSATNPRRSDSGSTRVIRGGGWYVNFGYCRSRYRVSLKPINRDNDVGFRVQFTITPF